MSSLSLLLFLVLSLFFFNFLASQLADVLITAGTETCEEAVQPSPLNVADEKFFFLEVVSLVGLEDRRIEEMVVLARLEFGSVSGLWLKAAEGFLGFLYLICSAIVESSATTTGMVFWYSLQKETSLGYMVGWACVCAREREGEN